MARKNSVVLGLLTPTRNPSLTSWPVVRTVAAVPAAIAADSERRSRHARTPRNTRYPPPISFMAVKTALDVATTAPRPAATATTWTQAPSVLPATVATAARRP